MPEPLLTRFLQPLLAGRRAECFGIVRDALQAGIPAERLVHELVWPAMGQVQRLYRDDRINRVAESMAARILRAVACQLQPHLSQRTAMGRRMVVTCADGVEQETGAELVADLFQADGWEVYFVGPDVPEDEMLALVGTLRPDALLIFGTEATGVPRTRRFVDLIREVGAVPHMNVIVSGGVFNRADGLWREVGADLFVESAAELIRQADQLGPRDPHKRRTGVVKKRRRKRKAVAQGV